MINKSYYRITRERAWTVWVGGCRDQSMPSVHQVPHTQCWDCSLHHSVETEVLAIHWTSLAPDCQSSKRQQKPLKVQYCPPVPSKEPGVSQRLGTSSWNEESSTGFHTNLKVLASHRARQTAQC
jgi:hypothetical protein